MKYDNDFDGFLEFSSTYHTEYLLDCQHQGVQAMKLDAYRKRYFFWLIDEYKTSRKLVH